MANWCALIVCRGLYGLVTLLLVIPITRHFLFVTVELVIRSELVTVQLVMQSELKVSVVANNCKFFPYIFETKHTR